MLRRWLAFGIATVLSAQVDVPALVHRSVVSSDRNWREAPNYTFIERDLEEKLDAHGGVKTKTFNTYEITMLEGTEYRRMTKRDERPLTAEEQQAEQQKLEAERHRRQHESPGERNRRISKYQKERQQDHAMMREMADAFDFKLTGEETVDGHPCYVLDATPKPGYVPKMRDTKVLTAMRGKIWVEKESAQWVKVEAEVMRPVSFYAVATVGPGTRFILEQEPVGEGVWLPKHFSVKVNATILFFTRNSLDDEHYSSYRRTR